MSEILTHWLKNPNKNYLGHWDLPDKDLILTIDKAGWEDVKDPASDKVESKRVVHFVENYKPLICNETNAILIYKSTGIRYLQRSQGSRIKLYVGITRNKKLKIDVECVRVRPEKVEPPKTIEDYPNEKKQMDNCKTLEEMKNVYLAFSQDLQRVFYHKKEELKNKLK